MWPFRKKEKREPVTFGQIIAIQERMWIECIEEDRRMYRWLDENPQEKRPELYSWQAYRETSISPECWGWSLNEIGRKELMRAADGKE